MNSERPDSHASAPAALAAQAVRLRSFGGVAALRGVALGGRFAFVVVAAAAMNPRDFGRFGLLAALAGLIPTVTGLEAHQILLREILQGSAAAADAARRRYGVLVIGGSSLSGALGAVVLAALGWPTTYVALGAVIMALEHVGLDTFRILINEHRPTASIASVASRTGLWGLALVGASQAGLITEPWGIEAVLAFWLAGDLVAVLIGLPIWPRFRPTRGDLCTWGKARPIIELLTRSWRWMAFTFSWRVLESGGRFLSAWFGSESAAGRFTYLSMLGSLSYVAQRGVVEPIYYPRLSRLDASEATYRSFRRANIAAVMAGSLGSAGAYVVSSRVSGQAVVPDETVALCLLGLAFGLLSVTQSSHYRLFRVHADATIMSTSVLGACALVVSGLFLTWRWGVAGAAAATLIGAVVLSWLRARGARSLGVAP